jgi:NTP pyrophosphatase (non-canonical NTP hydrolase)
MILKGPDIVTIDEFGEHVGKLFIKPSDHAGRCVHAAMCVAGEGGELIDAVKKHWIYGAELDTANILEECGDVLFYVAALLGEVGYNLNDAMVHNVAKLKKRYPQGFTEQAARDRADKAEPIPQPEAK